ncbi:MAG TPA: hypothetical protein VF441_05015 [Acidimicrobiia bacterium]
MTETLELHTADGETLEAETVDPSGELRAGAVLCHPHPQYGGTMRSIVISALFDALPRAGVRCLRFNFRGVERSSGAYGDGRAERHDIVAGIDTLTAGLPAGIPVVLIGWSFGADVALCVPDPRLAAWMAIAPPLRFATDVEAVARDPRPKLLALAEHDEFRDPASVREAIDGWANTDVEILAGATHYFVGRTDRLADLAGRYVGEIAATATSP